MRMIIMLMRTMFMYLVVYPPIILLVLPFAIMDKHKFDYGVTEEDVQYIVNEYKYILMALYLIELTFYFWLVSLYV